MRSAGNCEQLGEWAVHMFLSNICGNCSWLCTEEGKEILVDLYKKFLVNVDLIYVDDIVKLLV